EVSFKRSEAPPKRLVRLAAAHLKPEGGKSVADNLRMIEPLAREAAAQRADLLVFGELVTTQGTPDPMSAAETIPGPITHALGEMARRNNLYIVASLPE